MNIRSPAEVYHFSIKRYALAIRNIIQGFTVIFGLMGSVALAQAIPPELPPADPRYSSLRIYESFVADGDTGQCYGRAHGTMTTSYDIWSPPIRIDTDDRSGGCWFNLAIIDPNSVLQGWNASWAFRSYGDGGQCENQGAQSIQVVATPANIDASKAVRIDTDGRSGGCILEFAVNGPGPSLLIYFAGDGNQAQCLRSSDVQVADLGQSKRVTIDADGRPGGCLLQFRIR